MCCALGGERWHVVGLCLCWCGVVWCGVSDAEAMTGNAVCELLTVTGGVPLVHLSCLPLRHTIQLHNMYVSLVSSDS